MDYSTAELYGTVVTTADKWLDSFYRYEGRHIRVLVKGKDIAYITLFPIEVIAENALNDEVSVFVFCKSFATTDAILQEDSIFPLVLDNISRPIGTFRVDAIHKITFRHEGKLFALDSKEEFLQYVTSRDRLGIHGGFKCVE